MSTPCSEKLIDSCGGGGRMSSVDCDDEDDNDEGEGAWPSYFPRLGDKFPGTVGCCCGLSDDVDERIP